MVFCKPAALLRLMVMMESLGTSYFANLVIGINSFQNSGSYFSHAWHPKGTVLLFFTNNSRALVSRENETAIFIGAIL